MRSTRRTSARIAASAVAIVAAFSLTACQNDDTAQGSSQAPAAEASEATQKPAESGADQNSTEKPSDSSQGQDSAGAESGGNASAGKNTDSGTSGSGASGGSSSDGKETVTCTTANTKITVSEVTRPINHLMVTATNTGSVACNAFNAPYLRFDHGQAAVPFIEDSKPQAVVTIAPGESAYAAIATSGDGENGRDATDLDLNFANSAGDGSVGASKSLTIPGGSVYIDDSHQVTYWQSDLQDAIQW